MKKTYSVGLQSAPWIVFDPVLPDDPTALERAEQATDAIQREFEEALPENGPICGVSQDGRLSIRLEVSVSDPYTDPVSAISRAQGIASRVLNPRIVEFVKLDVEPVDA